jgi:hypothetical protein
VGRRSKTIERRDARSSVSFFAEWKSRRGANCFRVKQSDFVNKTLIRNYSIFRLFSSQNDRKSEETTSIVSVPCEKLCQKIDLNSVSFWNQSAMKEICVRSKISAPEFIMWTILYSFIQKVDDCDVPWMRISNAISHQSQQRVLITR